MVKTRTQRSISTTFTKGKRRWYRRRLNRYPPMSHFSRHYGQVHNKSYGGKVTKIIYMRVGRKIWGLSVVVLVHCTLVYSHTYIKCTKYGNHWYRGIKKYRFVMGRTKIYLFLKSAHESRSSAKADRRYWLSRLSASGHGRHSSGCNQQQSLSTSYVATVGNVV